MLTPGTFEASDTIDSIIASKTANAWRKTFGKTCYIYGLEMLAVLAILMAKNNGLEGRTATFYIDNNNALQALVKNSGNPIEIQALAALIWHRIRDLGIIPWFERVPSKRNIADHHTRNIRIKYNSRKRGRFLNLRKTHKLVEQAIQNSILVAPLEPPQ